jgi:hypothetical protein
MPAAPWETTPAVSHSQSRSTPAGSSPSSRSAVKWERSVSRVAARPVGGASAMAGSTGSACCATANTSPARATSAAEPPATSSIRSSMVGAASAAWYQPSVIYRSRPVGARFSVEQALRCKPQRHGRFIGLAFRDLIGSDRLAGLLQIPVM